MIDVSASECWDALQHDSNAYLIDVRTKAEWRENGIADLSSANKETKLITWVFFTPHIHANANFLNELEKEIEDKEASLYFICKSGGRSAQASQAAMLHGYKKCYNVSDGFSGNMFDKDLAPLNLNGWTNSNLPRRKM
jgi:rhodanese-related sulfurtransferase